MKKLIVDLKVLFIALFDIVSSVFFDYVNFVSLFCDFQVQVQEVNSLRHRSLSLFILYLCLCCSSSQSAGWVPFSVYFICIFGVDTLNRCLSLFDISGLCCFVFFFVCLLLLLVVLFIYF